MKVSKSRIRRLRGLRRPQYRLRIDDIRVFYDVDGGTVQVLAIIPKLITAQWLEEASNDGNGQRFRKRHWGGMHKSV